MIKDLYSTKSLCSVLQYKEDISSGYKIVRGAPKSLQKKKKGILDKWRSVAKTDRQQAEVTKDKLAEISLSEELAKIRQQG